MKYTIDRFEGKFAVAELADGKFANIPRSAIPEEAKEGDIISVVVDHETTKSIKKQIDEMTRGMWIDE